MDARETWQALQTRLTNARAAVEAGDRAGALAEIAAALDIDPDFLAAHSLRDRILAAPDPAAASPVVPDASAPSASSEIPNAAAPPDGYVKFEQRAKRRRVDRRLDAARAALEGGRLKAAAAALDEVIELDPNLPELPQLTAKFDALRRRAAATHRGPRFVAAAAFVVTVLAASLLHDSTSLISRPMIAAAPLVASQTPAAPMLPEVAVVATADDLEPVSVPDVPALAIEPANAASVEAAAAVRPAVEAPGIVPPPAPDVVPATRPVSSVPEPALASVSMPLPPPAVPPADDNQLIKQVLQRYRTAYEVLDAQAAHAIWPAVDQAALARAFDGLESQSLTFETCVVRLQSDSASATCEGLARYVPKIGSREPRTEPRVWNFSLHKAGDDWKIENARAER